MEINFNIDEKNAVIKGSSGLCVVESDYDIIKDSIICNNDEINMYNIKNVCLKNEKLSIVCSNFNIIIDGNVLVVNRFE